MKKMISISLLVALCVLAAVIYMTPDAVTAVKFYGEKIRASLFTGLLTVGSFLLSLKVFIVVKFKENVFDSEVYKKRLEDRRRLNPNISHYGPVRNLSRVLFLAITSSLIASASQITIGLIPVWWAMLFCVGSAAFAWMMLVQVLLLIRSILTDWLDHMEDLPRSEHTNTNV